MSNIAEIVKYRDDAKCVEAFTTSLLISDTFRKQHKMVLRKIDALPKDDFNRRSFTPVEYVDQKGQQRLMYEINRDGFTLLAMSFTGSEAYQWKVKFIDAFNKMEQHLKRIMTKGWLEHRSEAALESRAMSRTLDETRKLSGKETKAFHYANEHKLVNWAMTGEFTKLNRDELTKSDLKILCELQLHNTALIGAGIPREQRKTLLQERCRSLTPKLELLA